RRDIFSAHRSGLPSYDIDNDNSVRIGSTFLHLLSQAADHRPSPNRIAMFIIDLNYVVPLDQLDAHMAEHVKFLRKYYKMDVFVASGRKVPRTGGIILALAKSKEDHSNPSRARSRISARCSSRMDTSKAHIRQETKPEPERGWNFFSHALTRLYSSTARAVTSSGSTTA